MKRFALVTVVLAFGLGLASCANDQAAATSAITTAETAFATVQSAAMKVMPDETQAIADAIAAAKDTLASGDAKAALAAAKGLPDQVKQLSDAIPAKTEALTASFNAMAAGLPAVLETIQTRIVALAKSSKLPAGLDKAGFQSLQSGMAIANQMWADAQTAFRDGNLADAVSMAESVKQTAASALTTLQMPVPAALQ